MSEPTPEDDLETLFARQRAADRESAPTFHALRTRHVETQSAIQPATPLLWRWAVPAAAAIGLAIAATLIQHRPTPAAMQRDAMVREIEQIDEALQKSLRTQSDLTA